MSMELSIAHVRDLAYINNCSSLQKAHVIIYNNTDSTHYFYEDWNSYGYYNISFEIKTKDSIYEVIKPNKIWYRNFKSYFVLNPNESIVFPYLLVDTSCTNLLHRNRIFENGWIGFPPISDTVEIRAVYQLCHLADSIPDEGINRLNYRKEDYIDLLDGDIESVTLAFEEPRQEHNQFPLPLQTELIFHEVLYSSWQKVILLK